jgi:hypothetical protein
MEPSLLGTLMFLARATLSAWLFLIAGVILVVSHPRWRGSWLLLFGSILLSALAGVRLMEVLPRDSNVWIMVGFEAWETLGYVLSGIGVLLVSVRARSDTPEGAAAPDVQKRVPAA